MLSWIICNFRLLLPSFILPPAAAKQKQETSSRLGGGKQIRWDWWQPQGMLCTSGFPLMPRVCVCCLSVCLYVKLCMLPQHIFTSPVVMFTKSTFKYLSCGGKVINLHAEMMWSLNVPVRAGGWAGGEQLQQRHSLASAPGPQASPCHREGSNCWPLTLQQGSVCPLLLSPWPRDLEVPHCEGAHSSAPLLAGGR